MYTQKAQLIDIVGEEHVIDDDAELVCFGATGPFYSGFTPVFIVKPANTGEVRRIVKWANETGTPLVPLSSGAPHQIGSTTPSIPGAVIVDLRRMNKILSINRQMRIAVVEPGVTYRQLQTALAEKGLSLSMPLAPRADKSVVASVLEVEPRLNSLHQWSYIDPLRCVEVTWGDGNTIFTGEAGGMPMELETQWEKERWQVNGCGPMMVDFHRLLTAAQGTMGIVTWASLKCEVMHKAHKMFFVSSDNLTKLIAFADSVLGKRFSDELFITNSTYLSYLVDAPGEWADDMKKHNSEWIACIGVGGRDLLPELRMNSHEQDIAEIANEYDLVPTCTMGEITAADVMQKAINPSANEYWKNTTKGAFRDIFFVTTRGKIPGYAAELNRIAVANGYDPGAIGVYIQPLHLGVSYHTEFHFPYDPGNEQEVKALRETYFESSEAFAKNDAYYSRPYNNWSRLQLSKDMASYEMLQKVKGIFDPGNIMNPEKLSI